jgi:hypothetical protein
MNKVTYLFGAGASRLALPIMQDIPKGLINFRDSLLKFTAPVNLTTEITAYRDSLIIDINKILDDIVRVETNGMETKYIPLHASIDTYAKKLFIKGSDSLDKLKIILSLFFCFEQTIRDVDPRYDSFFASIIKNSFKNLPQSVNVVSWNYDSQFEIAFSKFTDIQDIKTNMEILNVVTKFTRENREVSEDRFSIYKINGTAAFHDRLDKLITLFRPHERITVEEQTIRCYAGWSQNNGSLTPSLSFAWEGESQTTEMLNLLRTSVKNTVALVIIGYSIPFFNRDIDRQIIAAMPGLKKVYFQSPEADALKERFAAFKEMDPGYLISKTNTDQFYLPNELSL